MTDGSQDLLQLLSTALGAPVLPRGESAGDRLVYALTKPSRVDHEGVSLIEAAIANARRLDDRFGSRLTMESALAQRHLIRGLLHEGVSGPVTHRLIVAGGQLSQFLGYLARELGDHATSDWCYEEAAEMAYEAGDKGLGAYILGDHAITVGGAGREPWRKISKANRRLGLSFVQAAASTAATKGSVATRSWLAGVEAEFLASLGDADGAERALDHARAVFSQVRPEDEPPWMYYRDAADLESQAGSVYLVLGRPEPARRALELALETIDSSMVRDRGKVLARLAATYVPEGEIDEACRVASQALTIATDPLCLCDRAVLRVRQLRIQLKPWKSAPTVRQLDDQLASTAAWVNSGSASLKVPC